jgi:hypothetical protein
MSSKYRRHSALTSASFFTDGGLETTLTYSDGITLQHCAAFDLLKSVEGRNAVVSYFRKYGEMSKRLKENFWLEAPTWRGKHYTIINNCFFCVLY